MCECIDHVQDWMASNRLLLKLAKTELTWLGSSRHLQQLNTVPLLLSGTCIHPSDHVRKLSVVIHSELSLSAHISYVTSTCFFHLRQLHLIRRSLTLHATHCIIRALIHSQVDYCNSLFGLQSFLRAAVCLVLSK